LAAIALLIVRGTCDADEIERVRPLTIVTHGFQTPGTKHVPEWTKRMVEALAERGVEECVVVDWVPESGVAAPGWTESAGDAVFARIMWSAITSDGEIDLHLIGHSRGAVVNSEAQRRLVWYERRIPVLRGRIGWVHVTMLDPHPANGRVGFWTGSPMLTQFTNHFERLAQDPEPKVFRGTSFVDVYMQRGEKETAGTSSVNPWGMLLDPADADIQVDLTGKFFERRTEAGRVERTAVAHTTMHEYYIETIRCNAPASSDGDVLSGGGFFYAAAGRGGSELVLRQRRPKRTIALVSVNPGLPAPVLESETVFNGDFRFKAGASCTVAGTDEKQYRIPGWRGEQPLTVTSEGRLRLAAPSSPQTERQTVSVTHNPMFIPPDAAAIELDASSLAEPVAGDESPRLTAYFVPVQLDDLGNLTPEVDRSSWLPIGSWVLSGDSNDLRHVLPFDSVRTVSMPIPNVATEFGTVGSIRFELSLARLSANVTDLVELDNVRLVIRPPLTVTVAAPNQVESRP
jgi:hypothetical protein